jgi:hypothetical protein
MSTPVAELGVGLSSVTSGRSVPALKASAFIGDWKLTGASTGVRTSVYAQNAWSLALLYEGIAAHDGSLDFRAHFGAGAALQTTAYRTSPTAGSSMTHDVALGPAWSLTASAGPFFLSFDGILGLRNVLQHVALNFQDVALVSIGVSL